MALGFHTRSTQITAWAIVGALWLPTNSAAHESRVAAPIELVGVRLLDADPDDNLDPTKDTNQTDVLVAFDVTRTPDKTIVHLALDPDFQTGHVTYDLSAPHAPFHFKLADGDGLKKVFARLELSPGKFGPVISQTILLDTVPPKADSVEINEGRREATSAYAHVQVASPGETAAKFRVRDGDSNWAPWRDVQTHSLLRLQPGDGPHTLEIQLCDGAGNLSEVTSTVIELKLKPSLADHRNLYNIDFGTYFWKPEQTQPEGGRFSAESIDRFVQMLAQSGVDTYVINANAKVPWYPSKATPSILTGYVRNDPDKITEGGYGPEMLNLLLDLQEARVDWLAESIQACRQNHISPWISVRMNDPHGTSPIMLSKLHQDSKFVMDAKVGGIDCGGLLNYQHKEVRDYYFAIIRELVENYDFDGLELDWNRLPTCMPPVASQNEIDTMTAWFESVRELTEAKAQRIGRPIYLGMHVPSQFKKLRSIGIDIPELAKRGLIDFLCPTNFMQTAWDMPIDRIKQEFGGTVAIYGVTEMWINAEGPNVSDDQLALRGNAAGKLVLGADGIEQYNFYWAADYQKSHPYLRDLHDLEALRGQSKHYAFSRVGDMMSPFDSEVFLPTTLAPKGRRVFRIPMCAELGGDLHEVTIRVATSTRDAVPNLGVTFNDVVTEEPAQTMSPPLISGDPKRNETDIGVSYTFSVDNIVDGWNEIVVSNSGAEAATIVGLELSIE